MAVPKGGLNQLPPWCTFSGDARIVPFYNIKDVQEKLKTYVNDLNQVPNFYWSILLPFH